jgi:hypothetical protein
MAGPRPFTPVIALAIRPVDGGVRGWQGRTHSVITAFGTTWVLKQQSAADRRRELTVSRLGRGLVNVAETRGVSWWEHAFLRRRGLVDPAAPRDALLLSRMATTYRSFQLPAKTSDAAIGGELCFSLWVRRRDPHVWNRDFTASELPVFFDLHASLDFEPTLRDLDEFFDVNLHGYGGAWRVRADSHPPATASEARMTREITTAVVRSVDAARAAAARLVPRFRARSQTVAPLLRRQGWSPGEASALADFLRETAWALPVALERMWDVATSNVPTPPEEGLIPDDLV